MRAGTPRAVGPDAANELEGIAIRLLPVPAEFWQEGNHLMLGFPFFFWYQFLWVFICSALTWTAYKLTLSARGKTTHKVGGDR